MARGIKFADDHYRVLVIMKLCTTAVDVDIARIMRDFFVGCTMVKQDLAVIIRHKKTSMLLTVPFAQALAAQGTLDEDDASITRNVLSSPQVAPYLNAVGNYWLGQLGQIPADQLERSPIDPGRRPRPLYPEAPSIPDRFLLALRACTKFLHSQISELLLDRIPNCRMDHSSVVSALYNIRVQDGFRLVDRPFMQQLQNKEDLDATDTLLVWYVVRSGQFAKPQELSEIGQHYWQITYNLAEDPNFVEPTLADLLGLSEEQTHPKVVERDPNDMSMSPSPPPPAHTSPCTAPQPVITATMDQLRAYRDGHITLEELMAAAQSNELHFTPLPAPASQAQGQVVAGPSSPSFGLSASAAVPEIFWDHAEDEMEKLISTGIEGIEQPIAAPEHTIPASNVEPFPVEYFQQQYPQQGYARSPRPQTRQIGLGMDLPSHRPPPPRPGPSRTQKSERPAPYPKR